MSANDPKRTWAGPLETASGSGFAATRACSHCRGGLVKKACKTGSRMVLANEHMAPHESSHPYMITALQVNARQATACLTANEKNECCA